MSMPQQAPEIVVPLQAEEAVISRQVVPGATVRVETVTRERDHAVDETIYKETVEFERVPVGREVAVMPEVVQDGDLTIVPIVEEVVVVTRKLILKEEIHLRRVKSAVQHQETLVLRKQEAVVTHEGRNINVNNEGELA